MCSTIDFVYVGVSIVGLGTYVCCLNWRSYSRSCFFYILDTSMHCMFIRYIAHLEHTETSPNPNLSIYVYVMLEVCQYKYRT